MDTALNRSRLFIGIALIVVGIAVIAYVLPQTISLVSLPHDAPFMQGFFNWLMADTDAINNQVSEEFFEIFQTFVKVIVLIVFLYVCVKLVTVGLMIIREGVSLIRPAASNKKDKV
ncbi:hypothetical protein M0C34_18385 [Agarivorans sp. TSD2052]|uniref:hypothetical protein n=1 Tax=Agarivorans sp. TSD2052 TaxID=2937286 RepID=UPI00200DA284|nr:hypothetical protein [Agarivorans sp. TSD2052]UPW18170.1 hypothetical protein M0C34_18385 [Agarivorans sp. TSD2052]